MQRLLKGSRIRGHADGSADQPDAAQSTSAHRTLPRVLRFKTLLPLLHTINMLEAIATRISLSSSEMSSSLRRSDSEREGKRGTAKRCSSQSFWNHMLKQHPLEISSVRPSLQPEREDPQPCPQIPAFLACSLVNSIYLYRPASSSNRKDEAATLCVRPLYMDVSQAYVHYKVTPKATKPCPRVRISPCTQSRTTILHLLWSKSSWG